MPTVLACLRRPVGRMWPRRVPTRFGPATRLRRPKNRWNQGPLATQQAEMCPRTANSGLDAFLAAHVARPATVATDGWRGYLGLPAAGYDHEPVNLGATRGDAALRLPAIHLVFSLVKRWLLGTHHGAVGEKHLPAYLDE